MQGIKRRVVYVTLFEGIAIALVTGVLIALGHEPAYSGVASVACSAVAMSWNLVWNSLFEAWEARQASRARTLRRRAIHALGFELGLTVALVPFFAWWLDISLLEALLLDISLLAFFLFYTFGFTWLFDHLFGLPTTAQAPR